MSQVTKRVSLLLVGRDGNGKSSTGNSILGDKKHFNPTSSSSSAGLEIKQASATVGDREVTVTEIAGLEYPGLDYTENFKDTLRKIKETVKKGTNGFKAIIFVLKYGTRFTKQEKDALLMIKSIFGSSVLKEFGVIVMTCGDSFELDVEEEEDKQTFDEWCQAQTGEVKTLFEDCAYRCVLFNNRTKDADNIEEQRDKLFSMVELIPHPYTLKEYKEAKKGQTEILVQIKLPKLEIEKNETMSEVWEDLTKIDKELSPQSCNFSFELPTTLKNVKNKLLNLKKYLQVEDQETGVLKHLHYDISIAEMRLQIAKQRLQVLTSSRTWVIVSANGSDFCLQNITETVSIRKCSLDGAEKFSSSSVSDKDVSSCSIVLLEICKTNPESQPKAVEEVEKTKAVEEVVQPEAVEEVVQPEAVKEVVQPEAVKEVVQHEAVKEVVQPEAVKEVVQPEAVEEVVQPEAVEDVEKTKAVEEVVQPKAVEEVVQPEAVEEVVQPEAVKEVVQPKAVEEVVQPEAVKEVVQPEAVEEVVQPKAVEEVVQPEAVKEVVQPKAVEEVVEPEAVKEVVQPEAVEEVVQPEAVKEVVQPEAVKEVVQPKAVEEVVQPGAVKEVVQPGAVKEVVQPKAVEEVEKTKAVEEVVQPEAVEEVVQEKGHSTHLRDSPQTSTVSDRTGQDKPDDDLINTKFTFETISTMIYKYNSTNALCLISKYKQKLTKQEIEAVIKMIKETYDTNRVKNQSILILICDNDNLEVENDQMIKDWSQEITGSNKRLLDLCGERYVLLNPWTKDERTIAFQKIRLLMYVADLDARNASKNDGNDINNAVTDTKSANPEPETKLQRWGSMFGSWAISLPNLNSSKKLNPEEHN